MTEPEQPKSRRGRPPKYAGEGKRQNFNFRITPKLRERLIAAVTQSGRSISEEIEFRLDRDLNWEETKSDIHKMLAEAAAIRSAARVQALRAAALMILRETEGRPTRVIVDLETLFAEADGLAAGLRPGVPAGESPPAPAAPRPMTAEEGERLHARIGRNQAIAQDGGGETLAADAAAAAKDGGRGGVTKTTFKQCDVERAVRAAKAVGLVVSVVEVVTPDGTTIRICGQRDPDNANPWDEVLQNDDPP